MGSEELRGGEVCLDWAGDERGFWCVDGRGKIVCMVIGSSDAWV